MCEIHVVLHVRAYHITLLIADGITKCLGCHPFHWESGSCTSSVVGASVDIPCQSKVTYPHCQLLIYPTSIEKGVECQNMVELRGMKIGVGFGIK